MNWLDIIILLPLLIGLVRGMIKGFVVELASILAIILGCVAARVFGGDFASWLYDIFAWPEMVCTIVAYVLIFVSAALSLHLIARFITGLFQKIALGWLNRLLGAVFGIIKWGIIVLVIVLCLHRLDCLFHFINDETKSESIIYNKVTPISEQLWDKAQKEFVDSQDKSDK